MPQEEEERLKTKLNDVWRTCNKIRATVFRLGTNLWDYFKKLDPCQNRLISEAKFIGVIGQQLRNTIGLSEQEIVELTDYFRVQDGRIAYAQFCGVIRDNMPDNEANKDLVTGLEWEDPMHKNRISQSEHRRLCLLLTKIAQSVRLRELLLRPYFQDYELVAKNCGTVTLAHFSRVLHFLGIMLSSEDFYLLVKRFVKDSYTVNYIAFVDEIEKIVQYLDTKRMIDYSNDIIENFPGRILDAELPKLPRPEIGTVNIGKVLGKESSFHPVLKMQKADKNIDEVVLRIQEHVLNNGLRVDEYFKDFDQLRSGYITKSQFLRGLDTLGVSALHRLFIFDRELEQLCDKYADDCDPSRVNWKYFELDIEKVCTTRCLDKQPFEIVESPPQQVVKLPRDGQAIWQEQTEHMRTLCEKTLAKCKARISKRNLYLEPFFRSLDRTNISHVTRSQMRQILLTNGVLLSDEEMYALERRYNDDIGFNYNWFLKEADPRDYSIPKFIEHRERLELINAPKKPRTPTASEKDIIQVMAKIKGQAVRRRIRLIDFMQAFDYHSEQCIVDSDFRRGLNSATIQLTIPETNLICNVFKSPLREGYIDYKRFCQIVEESFHQPCLELAPLIVPLQHFPSDDTPENFLNFKERNILANALEKLKNYPDQVSNLSSIFQDFDKTNCGTLSRNQFLRGLTVRKLNVYISARELETICKCYGIERGLQLEVDYRAFLKNLEILYANRVNYPF